MGNVVSTGLQLVGTASSPRLDQRLASAIKRTVELANSQDITPRERLHVKAMELFSQGWDPEAGCRSPNSWPFCPSIKNKQTFDSLSPFPNFLKCKNLFSEVTAERPFAVSQYPNGNRRRVHNNPKLPNNMSSVSMQSGDTDAEKRSFVYPGGEVLAFDGRLQDAFVSLTTLICHRYFTQLPV